MHGGGNVFMPEGVSEHAGKNFTFIAVAPLVPGYEAGYKFQEAVTQAKLCCFQKRKYFVLSKNEHRYLHPN